MKVLYTSAEIRKAVIDLFSSSKGRRVAVTAFVGEGAEAYLPKPKGLELICWPQVGGTNPNALRTLIKRGVQVSFVDSLHMKVYWTEDCGAVVTSANLSTNALGAGNLKEIGVLFAPGELKIDRIISSLDLRVVSSAELRKLDRGHSSYVARNRIRGRSRAVPFDKWYDLPFRPEWKLGWWDGESTDFSAKAKATSMEEFGIACPKQGLCASRGDYEVGEWILRFGLKRASPSEICWMYSDYVVRVSKSDRVYNSDYPYEADQVWPLKFYPPPPFRIDIQFRKAFSTAVREYGTSRIKRQKSLVPTSGLINSNRKIPPTRRICGEPLYPIVVQVL